MSKIFALDNGSNSIGWAVISADDKFQPIDIIDLGVRIFQKGVEDPRPTPKNQKRRAARLARRTIQRRARRKQKLLNFLMKNNLLPRELDGHLQPEGILNGLGDPYKLRAKALDHDLLPHELGRVLLHFVQRRGFLSNKKTLLGRDMLDDPDVLSVLDDDSDGGADTSEETAFMADISLLRAEIAEGGFRTLGEYLSSKPSHECKRNRHEEHIRTDRRMYMDELALIFERQSQSHPVLTAKIQSEIAHIIFHQRPIKLRKDRVGKCSLETNKKRAAIARLEYQRFRYLQDINNLAYFDHQTDKWVKINSADKDKLKLLFENSEKVTFPALKKVLGLQRSAEINLDSGVKHLKGNTTASSIRKVYPQWDDLCIEDQILLVEDLISIKKKSALKQRLKSHWNLAGEEAVMLCLIELEPEYGNVSLKAIHKLLPHLNGGLIYSDARVAAGYGYEVKEIVVQDKLGLPPEIPNPIVQKGLHELRRVVNALIAEHGKPDVIRIEMARDLEMNTKKYNNFIAQQRKNTNLNDKAAKAFRGENTAITASKYPSRDQKIKYRLWADQNQLCAYSGKTINLATLFSAEIEIDHILPYSLTLDDSYINKVVCFAKENQNKGQRTPKDAFGANEEKWNQITQALNRIPRELSKKRDAFYKTESDLLETDFTGSQLTDTRYMSKVAGDYLKTLGCDITFTRGIMTSWLRKQWGFNDLLGDSKEKERSDHRHHAIDAVVTACIDRPLYNALAKTAKELERTYSHLSMNDVYVEPTIANFKSKLSDKLDSMIVSFVPSKKITGALHEDTGVGFIDGIGTVFRARLDEKFDLKKAEKIIDPVVKGLVIGHLEKHNGNAKLAFATGFRLCHTDNKTLIKRVRVIQSKTTREELDQNKFSVIDRAGKPFKWHAYGNIHHVAIFQHKTNNKYKSEFVTAADAARRARGIRGAKQPIIQKNGDNDWDFRFALHKNELVTVEYGGEERIFRVEGLERDVSGLSLRCQMAATKKDNSQKIRKSISTLMTGYKMQPIYVNAIGNRVNDKAHH
mgnify:FL=1